MPFHHLTSNARVTFGERFTSRWIAWGCRGREYRPNKHPFRTMSLYPELGFWRKPSPEHRDRVTGVPARFNLTDHQHKTFAELSGGMKQKVLVARAFVSGAEVFVMDEPTSELDDRSERDVISHLFHLSRTERKTVLIAHHGLDDLPRAAPGCGESGSVSGRRASLWPWGWPFLRPPKSEGPCSSLPTWWSFPRPP